MELRDALSQIDEIRLHLARARIFRGFRAVPTAASGLLAGATALAQVLWLADPLRQPLAYAGLWIGCAAIAAALAGGAMALEHLRDRSELNAGRTREALARLAPGFAAGAVVSAGLLRADPAAVWLLPGLWAVLYSQVLFSCRSLLPRGIGYVAAAYLVAGGALLTLGKDALSPLTMGLTFGLGQLWAAWVLRVGLEREERDAAEA